MNAEATLERLASRATHRIDHLTSDRWAVTLADEAVRIDAANHPVWATLEVLDDGSLIFTGYQERAWGDTTIPYALDYRNTKSGTKALNHVTAFCLSYPTQRNQVAAGDEPTSLSLDALERQLHDSNAPFAAIPQQALARDYCLIRVVLPDEAHQPDPAVTRLLRYDTVVIDGDPLRLRVEPIRPSHAHTFQHIPLVSCASRHTLDDGIRRLERFVATDDTPALPPQETTTLPEAVAALVQTGADGVAVPKQPADEDRLTIRAWLPAQDGYDTVGHYTTVTRNTTSYTVNLEFGYQVAEHPDAWTPLYSEAGKTALPDTAVPADVAIHIDDPIDPYNHRGMTELIG